MLESYGGFGKAEYVTKEELNLLGAETCVDYCNNSCNCTEDQNCAISLKCAYNKVVKKIT